MFSEAQRQHHCESWRRSGLSMNAYCRNADVSVSTLSKWVRAMGSMPLLAPLPAPVSVSADPLQVEIILVNGVRVQIKGLTSIRELLKEIQEASSCN